MKDKLTYLLVRLIVLLQFPEHWESKRYSIYLSLNKGQFDMRSIKRRDHYEDLL